jgi:hypothetical protein
VAELTTSEDKVRRAKVLFGAVALGSLLAGLTLHLMQAQFGIGEDTARILSLVFILVGVADVLVLFLWDRLFSRGG